MLGFRDNVIGVLHLASRERKLWID